jgi:hypothetical protein
MYKATNKRYTSHKNGNTNAKPITAIKNKMFAMRYTLYNL